jgi:hypothetical protein
MGILVPHSSARKGQIDELEYIFETPAGEDAHANTLLARREAIHRLGHDLFAAGQTMLFAIVAFSFALLGMRLRKKTLAGEVEIYIHSQITSQPCRRPTGILKQHPKVAIAL